MDPVTRVASHYKLSELIASRLLASTKVVGSQYEIGFNMRERLRSGPWHLFMQTTAGFQLLVQAIDEYKRVCPAVFQWLQRGDFKPDHPPEHVTNAQIVHACRTAGRLRAKLLRHNPGVISE